MNPSDHIFYQDHQVDVGALHFDVERDAEKVEANRKTLLIPPMRFILGKDRLGSTTLCYDNAITI